MSSASSSIVNMGTDSDASRLLYDKLASSYEATTKCWGYNMPQKVTERLVEHIQRQGKDPTQLRILDAGAGDGLVGAKLQEAGFKNIIGIDLSPNMLEIAKKRGCYLETHVVDLNKSPLQFADEEFHIISCVGTLTYVDPEASSILEEFIRMTKPGGIICYTCRTDQSTRWEEREKKLEADGRWRVLEISEALPYLPNNPDYGDSVKVTIRVFDKL